ncbi:rod shape-determining protein MreD [Altererythrobacter aquiaggeris]|uniref:rod shape-determining protein MreD n=1 Tax=Aestuarierythrobacter aquiaggeris TaxID=1898396 RepID=UPI00301AAF5C
MAGFKPFSLSKDYGPRRINRDVSPTLATLIPWASVLLASVIPQIWLITGIPLLPPLGFLVLVTWRLSRPGLFPVWAAFPLGLWDDLLSGQPLGSAILLWSLVMIALEFIEARFPWRGFLHDWLTVAAVLTAYLVTAALFSGGTGALDRLPLVVPQLLLSIIIFPLIGAIVAILDRLRLLRIRIVK